MATPVTEFGLWPNRPDLDAGRLLPTNDPEADPHLVFPPGAYHFASPPPPLLLRGRTYEATRGTVTLFKRFSNPNDVAGILNFGGGATGFRVSGISFASGLDTTGGSLICVHPRPGQTEDHTSEFLIERCYLTSEAPSIMGRHDYGIYLNGNYDDRHVVPRIRSFELMFNSIFGTTANGASLLLHAVSGGTIDGGSLTPSTAGPAAVVRFSGRPNSDAQTQNTTLRMPGVYRLEFSYCHSITCDAPWIHSIYRQDPNTRDLTIRGTVHHGVGGSWTRTFTAATPTAGCSVRQV